jgi:UDP-glucose 4-epimerase
MTVIVVADAGYLCSEIYLVFTDNYHNVFTFWILDVAKKNSIAKAAGNIKVPALNNANLLQRGCTDYNDMCADCYLITGGKGSCMSVWYILRHPI